MLFFSHVVTFVNTHMGVDIAVRTNLKYLGDKAPYVEDSEEDDELFASESFFRATTADELGGMEVGWYSFGDSQLFTNDFFYIARQA